MVEQHRCLEEPPVCHQYAHVCPAEHHLCDPERQGDQHIDRMEPQRGSHIHVRVDVMDPVEPPQERHLVGRDVPPVKSVIHRRDAQHDLQRARQRQHLHKTPPGTDIALGQPDEQRHLDRGDHQHGARPQREIARLPACGGVRLAAQRPRPLGQPQSADQRDAEYGQG